MAPYVRVLNVTTQRHVGPSQARRWVELGVFAWVEVGVSIRRLTVGEMAGVASRLPVEPFPHAELRGVVTLGIAGVRRERNMAWQGTLFAVPSLAQELAADLGAMEARP